MNQKNSKPCFELSLWGAVGPDDFGGEDFPSEPSQATVAAIEETLLDLRDPPPPNGDAPPADSWLGGSAGREVVPEAALFENPPAWTEHWGGMPKFEQRDLSPLQSIYVHFRNEEDRRAFAALVGQTITSQTRSIWYPPAEIGRMVDKRYVDARDVADDEDGPLLPASVE